MNRIAKVDPFQGWKTHKYPNERVKVREPHRLKTLVIGVIILKGFEISEDWRVEQVEEGTGMEFIFEQ